MLNRALCLGTPIAATGLYVGLKWSQSKQKKTEDPSLLLKCTEKLELKAPGIITSFPAELVGSALMNKSYQIAEQATGKSTSLFSAVTSQFKANPTGILGATFLEHAVHRSMKVVVSEVSAKEFSSDNVGHLGSVLLPSLSVFTGELTIAPLHLLMIRVQSSVAQTKDRVEIDIKNQNIFRATQSILEEHGIRGLWRGATAFALKGFFFTNGQMMGWRTVEIVTGHKISEMSLPEHVSAVSTGAFFGTLTSAVPTKVFRDASMHQKTITQIGQKALQDGLAIYIVSAFNAKAILSKTSTKIPAHILQYTLLLKFLFNHIKNEV